MMYPCHHCDKKFTTKEDAKEHYDLVHFPKVYLCYHCGQEFTTKEDAKEHYDLKHLKRTMKGPNRSALIMRIIGNSVSVVASALAIGGAAAAPFTAGTSLIPVYLANASTAVSWAGGMTSSVASLVQRILDDDFNNQDLKKLDNYLKETGLSPVERWEGWEAVSALSKKSASNARKAASVSAVFQEMRESPVVKVNGKSMLFGIVDLVDASVKLYQLNKST